MQLAFGLDFGDLHNLDGLKKLDLIFLSYLNDNDQSLYHKMLTLRKNPDQINNKAYSDFLLATAPLLDDFLAKLFAIEQEVTRVRYTHKEFDIIYECKRKFVQRIAVKRYPPEKLESIDFEYVAKSLRELFGEEVTERKFAHQILDWLSNDTLYSQELDLAAKYSACAVYNNINSILFSIPKKKESDGVIAIPTVIPAGQCSSGCHSRECGNPDQNSHHETALVQTTSSRAADKRRGDLFFAREIAASATPPRNDNKGRRWIPAYAGMTKPSGGIAENNVRIGFDYFDPTLNLDSALNAVHYCIYCHKQEKDSCSKGLPQDTKKTGCPLKQKISEMNYVKSQGFNLAALAIIVIDNPMVAATGHRICNDCSNACIFQKQEPVDIPLVESNILETTLLLPYGVEIYLLLTRWNPLNIASPLPKPASNYKVLVAGLGPAGFSLSYYLSREGHNVVAIDGLKINPLDFDISKPIQYWQDYKENLSERVPMGFGGVAEYGITSRWDKNNLTLLRLILQRNSNIRIFGGISLGINITVEQAFELGFDHLAMCVGAGKPKIVQMKNALAKGVRTASDFLMTLQSGGAFLEKSITNLLIRMPVVVIGGGLTSIDAATESLNYYKVQVEKFYKQYQLSIQRSGKYLTEKNWTQEDRQIAEEFIEHAKLFNQAKDKESIQQILNQLGGATVYYRGKLQNSPAYKLNPEEVIYAMAAGVNFAENMTPIGINVDEYGYTESIEFDNLGERNIIRARTVITAIGTESNWHQQEMELAITSATPTGNCSDGCHSREGGNPDQNSHRETTLVQTASSTASSLINTRHGYWIPASAGMTETAARMTQPSAELAITYFGDCNPKFAGSVVKALASSKEGYKLIDRKLAESHPNFSGSYQEFLAKLDYLLLSHIHGINILSDKVVEIVVHSPLAATNFRAGQFFRLQNYSKDISSVIEPLALTGAYVDKEKNLIHLIILESGESSKLCRYLKVGEQIVLMGPSGTPTEILRDSNVVLIGGGLGNASLLPIAKALKDNNCSVTYFAAYKNLQDRFYQEKIEESSDVVVWCGEEGVLSKRREKDFSLQGNVVDGIRLFSQTLDPIDLIICIGSTSMMEAVKNIKNECFGKDTRMIISVNSPMQCMMKGICGQCVQLVKDQRGYVFACACQDQEAETTDFDCLKNRLNQNSLLEKLSNVIR